MTQAITLRPMTDADLPFLLRVYASTREEELQVTGWSREQKDAFLQQQFQAQHSAYTQQPAGTRFDVILEGDEPIGRLYVRRSADELRIVDIALLTEQRGRGIGGALVRDLLAEAEAAGKPVRIHVESNNPALTLYRRLGFRRVGDTGVYYLMEWNADGAGSAD